MQYKFVSQTGCRRVILFFAGWAMDAAPFDSLRRPGYDILVLWDYRDMYIDWNIIRDYDEICLVAWSFGVYAASVATVGLERRITLRIAVNGTLTPVDRRRGIPPAIYEGTLAGLTDRSLYKFYRRMSGDSATFASFREKMPSRSIGELREELEAMGASCGLFSRQQLSHWDVAVISMSDAIFPPPNQWRAWQGTPVVMLEAPHLINFQSLLDHYVIDKENMGEHFGRRFKSYDGQAGVQQRIAGRMSEKLVAVSGKRLSLPGARTLEIGSGTGMLSRSLDEICGRAAYLEMWDIAGDPPVEGKLRRFRRCDAEMAIRAVPGGSFDCIASASTMQWFNSPQCFINQCRRVLAPGGLLLLSTFVDGNLDAVARASGRRLPLLSARQWHDVIPGGMEILVFETYSDNLEFDTALQAFEHLRATGVNSLGRSAEGTLPLTQVLRRFPCSLDGRYRLNYNSLIMLLRKNA